MKNKTKTSGKGLQKLNDNHLQYGGWPIFQKAPPDFPPNTLGDQDRVDRHTRVTLVICIQSLDVQIPKSVSLPFDYTF